MWNKIRLHLDSDVITSILLRGSTTLSGLISAYIVVAFLSLKEQGYWYTFNSLLAIAAFAELGAGQILLRFVAHETSRLATTGQQSVAADRLRNLFKFTLTWGASVSGFAAMVAVPLGVAWMWVSSEVVVAWLSPWLLAGISLAPTLFLAFLNSFFEGAQFVSAVNFRRLVVSWVVVLVTAISAYAGYGLWCYGVGKTLGAIVGLCLVALMHKNYILNGRLLIRSKLQFAWRSEFLPIQKRYALTWVTGLLVNGIYAPVIFRFAGAEAAGKFGMATSIVAVMSGIASSWLTARQAKMAKLAGAGNKSEVGVLLKSVVAISTVAYLLGVSVLVAIMSWSPEFLSEYLERILPMSDMIILSISGYIWILISVYTTHVRSFNVEPFVRIAWIHAAFTAILCYPAISFAGVSGIVTLSCIGNLLSVTMCYNVSRKYL